MNLGAIVNRKIPPEPWAEGETIPWSDPEFSARMLREHLSQAHDAASRRTAIIDQHVNWIHGTVLAGRPSKILDLGCGPGLYTSRLARLGHSCTGIDFGPASIAYAREEAEGKRLDCRYIEADVRAAVFGEDYDLAMMIHGEFNVFRPEHARALLRKARQSMAEHGRLLLEVHPVAAVRRIGEQAARWSAADRGLFSSEPHLYLREFFWDADAQVSTQRHYVIDAATGSVTRHAGSLQGYSEEAYAELLTSCGFEEVRLYRSLGGPGSEAHSGFVVYVARSTQDEDHPGPRMRQTLTPAAEPSEQEVK